MISGASQADIGVLIISARKGEFETGFERGGQTREHAVLAKTLGVEHLIVAVNKMDDPSVEWSQDRYDEIVKKTGPFLKQNGYKLDQNVVYLPISGLAGDNLKERKGTASWYTGPTLWEVFDTLKLPERDRNKGFRIPLLEGFKDMGSTMGLGKVEQGTVKPGTKAILMPTKVPVLITSIAIEDDEVSYALPGENIRLQLKGVDEEQVGKGFVLCPAVDPLPPVRRFKAQVLVTELLEARPLITAGYNAILHVHTSVEECQIMKLYECTDMKTKKKEMKPRFAKEGNLLVCGIEVVQPVGVAAFGETPQLGRFTLRDEGKTIAIGKILEVSNK
jgi:peptide chain release factor subunit 3